MADVGSCAPDDTNPDDCSEDPASSSAAFAVGPGDHEITIQAIDSPFGSGAAFLRADANPALDHLTCYRIKPEDGTSGSERSFSGISSAR